eukprot:212435-Hanusia_phi.AAC.1
MDKEDNKVTSLEQDLPPSRLAVYTQSREEESGSSSDEQDDAEGILKVFCPVKHANFSAASSMVRKDYNREIGAMIQSEIEDGEPIGT